MDPEGVLKLFGQSLLAQSLPQLPSNQYCRPGHRSLGRKRSYFGSLGGRKVSPGGNEENRQIPKMLCECGRAIPLSVKCDVGLSLFLFVALSSLLRQWSSNRTSDRSTGTGLRERSFSDCSIFPQAS